MNRFSSNHLIRKALLFSVFVFILNCKKDENFVGTELQNEDIGVSQTSDFSLTTYTTLADSLRADELSVSTLGSYVDPVLGKTSSSFYSQLRIPVDNVDFAGAGSLSDIVLDSVILTLEYSDYYGNLDPQNFEVYEVMDDIEKDSLYYNGKSFSNTGTNLVQSGMGMQTPNPTDKVVISGDTLPAQLRIKLDNALGQRIINESGNSTIANNTNFAQFFKGIEVKVNNPGQASGQGGIFIFNLLSTNSNITLYYRNTASADTATFDLLLNANCARVNKNEHDYTGTAVAAQLTDSLLGKNAIYIQGLQGLITQVKFDDILKLKDSNIIINKAVLSFPVDYTSGSTYEPIEQNLIIRNEEGIKFLIPDQSQYAGQAGLDNVGGKWNEDEKQYDFIVTRYLTNVISGKFPNGNLTLECISAMVTPNRSVLYGSNSMIKKPILTITYTKY